MRIAVTGASGFLGGHIVKTLLLAGMQVRAVVRRPEAATALARQGCETALADLEDKASLKKAFQGCDAVISNAAMLSWSGAAWSQWLAANVDGARRVVEATADAGVGRLIHISTIAAVNPRANVLNPAHTPMLSQRGFSWSFLGTDRQYARSKALGEQAVVATSAALGVATTVLRPGPIYGSNDPKYTTRLMRKAQGSFVFLPGVSVPHVHAADVAIAACGALKNPASAGRAYFTTGPSVPLAAPIRALVAAGYGRARIFTVPLPLWLAFDDQDAVRDLGFAPRSIEAGMQEVLEQAQGAAK